MRALLLLALLCWRSAPRAQAQSSTLSQLLGGGPASPTPQATPRASPQAQPPPPPPSPSTPSPTPARTSSPSPNPTAAPSTSQPPTTGGSAGASAQGFIRVSGGQFVDGACRNFLFSGWNSWRLVDATLNIANSLPQDKSVLGGDSVPTYLFKQANAAGLTVARFFSTSEVNYGEGSPLQTSPGVYNETVAKGIDYIINEASKYNIKLILSPIDWWKETDGVQQYVKWCAGGQLDSFWTSSQCQQLYKNHMSWLLNRVNTYNQLAYKNDPTIFAWDLINEPRQSSGDTGAVDAWISMMAPYVKGIDSNHLVTVGEEGFFSGSDPQKGANPGPPGAWATQTGQDFNLNQGHPDIDFYGIHIWPDNWKVSGTDFVAQWIAAHEQVAIAAGKPLIVEEFGKVVYYDTSAQRVSERNPYFAAVYNAVQSSISSGGAIKGALFWEWTVRGQGETLDVSLPNGLHPYGVSDFDETFQGPVKANAQFIASKTGGLVQSCSSGSTPASTVAAAGR